MRFYTNWTVFTKSSDNCVTPTAAVLILRIRTACSHRVPYTKTGVYPSLVSFLADFYYHRFSLTCGCGGKCVDFGGGMEEEFHANTILYAAEWFGFHWFLYGNHRPTFLFGNVFDVFRELNCGVWLANTYQSINQSINHILYLNTMRFKAGGLWGRVNMITITIIRIVSLKINLQNIQ